MDAGVGRSEKTKRIRNGVRRAIGISREILGNLKIVGLVKLINVMLHSLSDKQHSIYLFFIIVGAFVKTLQGSQRMGVLQNELSQ